MHDTAEINAKLFFQTYVEKKANNKCKILEVGSWSEVGFLIRSLNPIGSEYIGLDIQHGRNVDIVSENPHRLPFEDNEFDFVVSSSCFEHDEMFWVTYLEIIRILKPSGVFYLNVPSNGIYHAYPTDCWRFYLDSGDALVKWGKFSGYKNLQLIERFISEKISDIWEDYVCVFIKDSNYLSDFEDRMIKVEK